MQHVLLDLLKKRETTAADINRVADLLRSSRVYDFLRERGRAGEVHPATPNFVDMQAFNAARSIGYNECLDDIMLFREKFIEADPKKEPPRMSFGGLAVAVEKGDLTEGEANAIRAGEPIPKLTGK